MERLLILGVLGFLTCQSFSFHLNGVLKAPARLGVRGRDTRLLFSKRNITDASQYLGPNERKWLIGSRPNNGILLALANFNKEVFQIFESIRLDTIGKADKANSFPDVLGFTLSNEAVQAVELQREQSGGRVNVHPIARALYDFTCFYLDKFFDNRPIERFWLLETVARTPYFACVSVLHLYESMGWWRAATLRKVHNAEEWNELHHLLIMESLGGDRNWRDRFLGYHAAMLCYWLLVATYIFSPAVAYQFMALLEAHAVDTYSTFLRENESVLRGLPAPEVAVKYYCGGDLYEFDEFQVSRAPGSRRPPCDTLYDVFANIVVDEGEHVSTMKACQRYAEDGPAVVSPHEKYANTTSAVSNRDGMEGQKTTAIKSD